MTVLMVLYGLHVHKCTLGLPEDPGVQQLLLCNQHDVCVTVESTLAFFKNTARRSVDDVHCHVCCYAASKLQQPAGPCTSFVAAADLT